MSEPGAYDVDLPEQTTDDTDRGWGELPDDAAADAGIERERPPHW